MEIKPEYEKGLFGSVKGIKGVTVSDIENLKATAIKGLEARDRLEKLTFEYERVKKLVPTMDERMRDAQDKIRLEQLEKAFQRLPEHIQKQLLPAKEQESRSGSGKIKRGAAVAAPSLINDLRFSFRWVARHPIKSVKAPCNHAFTVLR